MVKVSVRDLFDDLNPKEYQDIEIKNISLGNTSLRSVKKRVFEEINKDMNSEKEKGKKKIKKSFKSAWAAVIIIFVISTTVFAISKPEIFKWIFGEDAKITEENIQDVVATTSDADIIFTVESLLSDGNQNYFVISLENKNGERFGDVLPIITINTEKLDGMGFMSMGSKKINGPDNLKNKAYYLFEVKSNRDLMGKNAELILEGLRDKNSGKETIFNKKLKVFFNIGNNNDNNIRNIVVENPQIINNKYYVTEIKLSNLGMNLKGKEIETTSTIPIPNIKLKYKNGDIRDLSYKTNKNPHVDFPDASHGFSRDQNKKEFTNTITFGELIDVDAVESIIVNGKEYKVNK